MPKVLSVDLRERVVAAVAAGSSRRAAAARFGVSVASAVRWCALARKQGSVAPRPQGGDRRSARLEAHADFLRELLARQPDLTLAEIQAELAKERGLSVAISTLWRFFDRHRITRKKSPAMPLSRTAPTS